MLNYDEGWAAGRKAAALEMLAALRAMTPPNQGGPPNLFVHGSFQSHSGLTLPFKIDCDALSDADLSTLAAEVARTVGRFRDVRGVPRGGLRFAAALARHATGWEHDPMLIVDDVLTTGASVEESKDQIGSNAAGVVIFARGEWPPWVTPLFVTGSAAKSATERARREERDAFVAMAEQFIPYCGTDVQPALRSVLDQTRRALTPPSQGGEG